MITLCSTLSYVYLLCSKLCWHNRLVPNTQLSTCFLTFYYNLYFLFQIHNFCIYLVCLLFIECCSQQLAMYIAILATCILHGQTPFHIRHYSKQYPSAQKRVWQCNCGITCCSVCQCLKCDWACKNWANLHKTQLCSENCTYLDHSLW